MAERLVVFADQTAASNDASTSSSSYQLLALPPALLTQLVASTSTLTSTAAPFEIRGDGTDSAVLVTESQTYSLRGVQNSNSLCVCTGSSSSSAAASNGSSRKRWFGARDSAAFDGEEDPEGCQDELAPKRKRDEPRIEIETVLHETLELVPAVARLEKLEGLLRGTEYTGGDAPESGEGKFKQPFTFDTLRSRLPASDAEIRQALSRHRVVTTYQGFLRPLPPAYLLQLLPAVLSALPLPARLAHPERQQPLKGKNKASSPQVSGPLRVDADEQDLLDALDAVECGDEEIARQLLEFFGTRDESGKRSKWDLDALAVVKELGIVLLAQGGFGQQPAGPFLDKWKSLAGGFAPVCELSLLVGLHLFRPAPISSVQYLPPSRLAPDPATRFSELFALQPRWLEGEMSLFVDDLTGGDKKKRDALVLKFVRKVKEREVVYWTARNLWG
ncbi:hypothetical protein C6P46_000365 [Rhodotorula mucilaginosa]|uniref:Sister chromatid cohesion protein DCC1 n=1 Tax=Rhodotorula mucilaginosa TaxID=5537 RepID=A0A9P6VWW9_RHOMI|nr:hypothetical protein C6P46_000365 [Rhodotorula mucilaginosa]TKA50308.1 hypothetical protein B0A53_06297 [Rhodotorula sp. CCFEE 5036]